MRRLGFSVVELLTAILIIAIMMGTFTLSPNIGKLSAKREAEKLAAKIINMTRSAARRRENFTMMIANDKTQITFQWEVTRVFDEPFTADKNFSLTWNIKPKEIEYQHPTNDFNLGCTITIKRDDGQKYYVVIATRGGRVRASKTPGWGKNQDDDDEATTT